MFHTTDWRYGCRVLVHVLKHVFDLGHSLDDPWGHLTGVKVQPGAPGFGHSRESHDSLSRESHGVGHSRGGDSRDSLCD